MAIPALMEFDENKINAGRYAVKFVDRNGTEIGQRGILHSDAVGLEELPDHLIKATLATEDRRFFEHFGIDVLGTARALFENARANDVHRCDVLDHVDRRGVTSPSASRSSVTLFSSQRSSPVARTTLRTSIGPAGPRPRRTPRAGQVGEPSGRPSSSKTSKRP